MRSKRYGTHEVLVIRIDYIYWENSKDKPAMDKRPQSGYINNNTTT